MKVSTCKNLLSCLFSAGLEVSECLRNVMRGMIKECVLQEAIAAGSYLTPPKTIQSGDVVAAMSKAERVLEGEIRMGGQEHFYLETQATLVVPKDGDGEMEIFCSCQDPAYIQVSEAAD